MQAENGFREGRRITNNSLFLFGRLVGVNRGVNYKTYRDYQGHKLGGAYNYIQARTSLLKSLYKVTLVGY